MVFLKLAQHYHRFFLLEQKYISFKIKNLKRNQLYWSKFANIAYMPREGGGKKRRKEEEEEEERNHKFAKNGLSGLEAR